MELTGLAGIKAVNPGLITDKLKEQMTLAIRNSVHSWGSLSKLFHWGIAILILTAIVLGWTAELMELSPLKLNLFIYHKSIGITVLFLVALRLVWKLSNPLPLAPAGISAQNARLANAGHWGLYMLMFAMPVSGWILNSAANFPFKWFGIFPVPFITGANEMLQGRMELVHLTLSWILLTMSIGHAGMAVVHHVKHRNEVLTRMLPENIGLTVLYSELGLLVVVLLIAGLQPESGNTRPTSTENIPAAAVEVQRHGSEAIAWEVDYAQSLLGFTASYAGSEFDGRFKEFSATIHFDPDSPATSAINVSVTVSSVNTDSADRDSMLADKDWFDFKTYPLSTFSSRSITHVDANRYTVNGILDIKGRQRPVDLALTWHDASIGHDSGPDQARLLVETTLQRGDFGIGEGMWAADETIGYTVTVHADLHLSATIAE